VLIISGHYFFFGHDETWRHRHECLRMTFTMDERTVRRGIQAIGEEVRRAHEEARAAAAVTV
jgi:valine--pyruvate aminotransferase